MGVPKQPNPVIPFVVILSPKEEMHSKLESYLIEIFGSIIDRMELHSWNYSPLYVKEMGDNIKRSILMFGNPSSPSDLAGWKIATNSLEERECNESAFRSVNLDPGYLDGTNVILASTKRYGNRVYLRNGIYADLTLYYDGKSFKPFKLTFPDYSTKRIITFFNKVRNRYIKEILHLHKQNNDLQIQSDFLSSTRTSLRV